MKKISLLLVLLLLSSTLGGCQSSIQPVNKAYVISLGIDVGEVKDYKITFLIPYLAADAGSGKDSTYTIGIECESLVDAINAVNVNNPNTITLTHINFVIFGEEFLTDEGLNGLVISMCRNVQMNWSANIVACKGSAADYIQGIQAEKDIDIDSLQDNIMDTSQRSGFYPNYLLIDAYDTILSGGGIACALAAGNKKATEELEEKQGGGSSGSGGGGEEQSAMAQQPQTSEQPADQEEQQPNLPGDSEKQQETMEKLNLLQMPGEFPRTGGLGSDISGAAILEDGKMVGTLTGHDARCLMMITDGFVESSIVITNPFAEDGIMGVKTKRAKGPRIKVITGGDKPRVEVQIYLMITSFTHNKPDDYTQPDKRGELAQHVNDSIKAEMDFMLEKVKQYGVDIFGFGKYAAKNFLTTKAYEDYDWPEKFKQAEIDVTIETWFIHPDFDKQKVVSE